MIINQFCCNTVGCRYEVKKNIRKVYACPWWLWSFTAVASPDPVPLDSHFIQFIGTEIGAAFSFCIFDSFAPIRDVGFQQKSLVLSGVIHCSGTRDGGDSSPTVPYPLPNETHDRVQIDRWPACNSPHQGSLSPTNKRKKQPTIFECVFATAQLL